MGNYSQLHFGRILVVDKDVHMLTMLKMILCREYRVCTARSAEGGLDLMSSDMPFQIVMTSFNLPGMNGLEFLKRVHSQFPSSVRLLMAGSLGNESEIHRAMSEGHISRVIMKPFCVSTLLEHLKKDLAWFPQEALPSKKEKTCLHTH